jgi:hypothetical protein
VRGRREKQLAYERGPSPPRQERTRKQKRAARLLGQGMTQQAVAAELGVTTRTLRNWKAAPAFRRERERQHKHAARPRTAPSHSRDKTAARQDAQNKQRDRAGEPRPAAQPQPDRPPAPPGQQQTIAEQAPAIDVEQAERDGPFVAAEEQADAADPPRSPSTSQADGVPIFPDTPDGRAARLAYYEARKLNNLPNSLFDYNDATTAVHDRPTAIKRVALPPKRDSEPLLAAGQQARLVGRAQRDAEAVEDGERGALASGRTELDEHLEQPAVVREVEHVALAEPARAHLFLAEVDANRAPWDTADANTAVLEDPDVDLGCATPRPAIASRPPRCAYSVAEVANRSLSGRKHDKELVRGPGQATPVTACSMGSAPAVSERSHPVGCIYSISRGGGFVFVDESAEQIASSDRRGCGLAVRRQSARVGCL